MLRYHKLMQIVRTLTNRYLMSSVKQEAKKSC